MRLREHNVIVSRSDALRVDPRQLKVTDGYNVRDFTTPQAQEALAILKESIREEGGVLVPLEVRKVGEDIHIVSGHRRHRAVMELIAEGVEIETVPAVTEAKTTNDAERILRLIMHNAGEPLSMLEKAEVVRRLINMGWDRDKIAKRLGYKTPQSIANFEMLLAAPEVIKQAIREQEISPSTAVELVRQHGDAAGSKLVDMKEAAEKRGKDRATLKDLQQPMPSITHVAAVEKRTTDTEQAKRDVSDAEDAIGLLFGLTRRGVKPSTVVETLGAADDMAARAAARWLEGFISALSVRGAA